MIMGLSSMPQSLQLAQVRSCLALETQWTLDVQLEVGHDSTRLMDEVLDLRQQHYVQASWWEYLPPVLRPTTAASLGISAIRHTLIMNARDEELMQKLISTSHTHTLKQALEECLVLKDVNMKSPDMRLPPSAVRDLSHFTQYTRDQRPAQKVEGRHAVAPVIARHRV